MLTSSLTMALAVHAAAKGRRKALMAWLALTAALGALFLALKGLELQKKEEQERIKKGRTKKIA